VYEVVRQRQIYLNDTNILLTRFLSREGVAEVSDFLPWPLGPESSSEVESWPDFGLARFVKAQGPRGPQATSTANGRKRAAPARVEALKLSAMAGQRY
jgi:hypothetical protein